MIGESPRKQMASSGGGSFGVDAYPGKGASTPVPPETGRRPELGDSERGVRERVSGMGAHHGRQAAPDHGPVPDHFMRGGKV